MTQTYWYTPRENTKQAMVDALGDRLVAILEEAFVAGSSPPQLTFLIAAK